jgi:hypothetical protein
MVWRVKDNGSNPFSREVLEAYVAVIRQAYEANGDRIDPGLGHNEGAFRYLLYQTITYLLPGAMKNLDVRIEQDNSVLLVREGAFGLRTYAIGTSEFDDPWRSFPSNRGGAPAAAAVNQMQMAMFPEETLHPDKAGVGTEYILGHCGTSIGGFRAVYLCLPVGSSVDETVRQWAQVHTIYRADSEDEGLALRRPTGPIPIAPIVVAPPPLVALRSDEEPAADAD